MWWGWFLCWPKKCFAFHVVIVFQSIRLGGWDVWGITKSWVCYEMYFILVCQPSQYHHSTRNVEWICFWGLEDPCKCEIILIPKQSLSWTIKFSSRSTVWFSTCAREVPAAKPPTPPVSRFARTHETVRPKQQLKPQDTSAAGHSYQNVTVVERNNISLGNVSILWPSAWSLSRFFAGMPFW